MGTRIMAALININRAVPAADRAGAAGNAPSAANELIDWNMLRESGFDAWTCDVLPVT